MKNKLFMSIITVLLVAVLTLQVVTLIKLSDPDVTPEQEEMVGEEVVNLDVSVINVDTPYGILKYPSQWVDQMMVVDKEVDGVDTVVFSANLNEKECELFTVIFGTEHDDIYVGDIDHNGKTIRVGIQMAFIDETAWTAEEYKTLCEMQKAKDRVQQSILEEI